MGVFRAILLLVDTRVKDVAGCVLVDLFSDNCLADWRLL
jgi:hypothetical protein